MKKTFLASLLGISFLMASAQAQVANPTHSVVKTQAQLEVEQFTAKVLIDELNRPHTMQWGADGTIWLIERQSKQISQINPTDGSRSVLYTVDQASDQPQRGVLGMALHPNFLKGKQEDDLYLFYTYPQDNHEWGRVVRLRYDATTKTLGNETVILDKLPAGSANNSGQLAFDSTGKLLLTLGDTGDNLFTQRCQPIRSQNIPQTDDIIQGDFRDYRGKVLRLNLDGSIPEDNPRIQGILSHVYAYGLRNPQGLAYVGKQLFSVDQGAFSDDEVNLLQAGGNYGWPEIAGLQDNQAYRYVNYSQVENCEQSASFNGIQVPNGVKAPISEEQEAQLDHFQAPLKTLYTVPNGYVFDEKCGMLCAPTIGASALAYYPKTGKITHFQHSLLVAGEKTGTLYRLPLDAENKQLQGEAVGYFRTDNRYQSLLISPDSRHIYVATDSAGEILSIDGKPTKALANRGAILVFSLKEEAKAEEKTEEDSQNDQGEDTNKPDVKVAD